MADYLQTLLNLTEADARRRWFQEHFPERDGDLINQMREASYRFERDDPHKALHIAQIVAEAAAIWRDDRTQAVATLLEANGRRLLGQPDQAVILYKQASTLYRQLGLNLDAAKTVVGQLDALMYLGQYEAGVDIANWAIDILRAADDQAALGRLTMNLGNIYARLGQFDLAQANYQEASQTFSALSDHQHLAMVEANEANVLINLNDFRQAQARLKQARQHFEQEGMLNAVAQVDHNLAYLYFAQGDYQQALQVFNKARSIFVTQNSAIDIAYVDLYRSDVYLALNLWQEALSLAQNTVSYFEESNMSWETARLWLNQAVSHAHLGQFSEMALTLDQARKIFDNEQNALWLAVTDFYQASFDWRRGNYEVAQQKATTAGTFFRQHRLTNRAAYCEIVQGEIYLAINRPQEATNHFTEALNLIKSAHLPAITFACHFGLGRANQTLGHLDNALNHYRQAVADVERLQTTIGAEDYKIAFLSDKLRIYQALAALCLNMETPEHEIEAFQTIERAKSRTLFDTLTDEQLRASTTTNSTEHISPKINDLKRELTWYYNRLYEPQPNDEEQPVEQILLEISEREARLTHQLKAYYAGDLINVPGKPISTTTLQQIQAALPADTLLLEFYVVDETIVVFGIDAEQHWVRELPATVSEVSRSLDQFRFQLNKFSYGADYWKRQAQRLLAGVNLSLNGLYQMLLEPIQANLTAQTLIIVPHQLLHYIPFQALYDGKQYVIEYKQISTAPSATILHWLLTQHKPSYNDPPLILAIPDQSIPHAQTEAEAIAALFNEVSLYLNDEATTERLLQHELRPSFIHLCTHAAFRTDNPLYSSLKLGDDWVTVYDLRRMTTAAPLVTLSGCETGRSQILAGDELIGLCRGFFAAGAQSLVVSHWPVDDYATARLMAHFYQQLKAGQPVIQALRSAQLSLMSEETHPYFWASFGLAGNPWLRLQF